MSDLSRIVNSVTDWFEELLIVVNKNWLIRDVFVCGFLGLCLDLIFRKKKDEDNK